jgi:signal transduction histidine kinase
MGPGPKLAAFFTESRLRIISAGAVIALIVGAVKFGLILFLLHVHTPQALLKLQDSVLTGVLAALAVCAVLVIARERRRYIRNELKSVANLNHELRNALEVLVCSEYLAESSKGEAILESVERINRTLNDLLGSGPGKNMNRPK